MELCRNVHSRENPVAYTYFVHYETICGIVLRKLHHTIFYAIKPRLKFTERSQNIKRKQCVCQIWKLMCMLINLKYLNGFVNVKSCR